MVDKTPVAILPRAIRMYEIMTKKGRNWQVLVLATELQPHLDVIQFLAQSGVAVRITWFDKKGS